VNRVENEKNNTVKYIVMDYLPYIQHTDLFRRVNRYVITDMTIIITSYLIEVYDFRDGEPYNMLYNEMKHGFWEEDRYQKCYYVEGKKHGIDFVETGHDFQYTMYNMGKECWGYGFSAWRDYTLLYKNGVNVLYLEVAYTECNDLEVDENTQSIIYKGQILHDKAPISHPYFNIFILKKRKDPEKYLYKNENIYDVYRHKEVS